VRYWGAGLGEPSAAELAALVHADQPQTVTNGTDEPVPVAVLPEQSAGWLGTPGLAGSRDGAGFSTAFRVTGWSDEEPDEATVARRVVVAATDPAAGLSLRLEIELTHSGLVRQ